MSAAETLERAAEELADAVVKSAGSTREFHLTLATLASPAPAETRWRPVLEEALRARGLQFSAQSGAADHLLITLSENSREFLLVAEIRKGVERKVVMAPFARTASVQEAPDPPKLTLEKKLLWEQQARILDAAWSEDTLLILDPEKVSFCRWQEGRWVKESVLPLARAQPWPRDLRGRIVSAQDTFSAYLPGVVCRGQIRPELRMSCQESHSLWPLQPASEVGLSGGLAGDRNFFSSLATEPSAPQPFALGFFSAAFIRTPSEPLWLFAHEDGVRLYSRIARSQGSSGGEGTLAEVRPALQPSLVAAWGSDLAGISPACGLGGLVLATTAADNLREDSVQAYEFVDHQPVAVSHPVSFPGPVTALWSAASAGTAVAVARDLSTGRYAAYQLSTLCRH